MEKRCSKCRETKPVSEFYKDRAKPSGLSAYCKTCERIRHGVKADTPFRARSPRVTPPDGMKHCYACKAPKPTGDFAVDRQKRDGRDSYCLSCRAKKSREFGLRPKSFDPDFKRCEHCGETKPSDAFYRAETQFDGRSKICKECARAWKYENPARRINAVLKYKYRVPHGTYERMHEAQGGMCAICGEIGGTVGQDRLALDHCHLTGVVRGLLCRSCNLALGFMRDSEKYLLAAIEYLRKHR